MGSGCNDSEIVSPEVDRFSLVLQKLIGYSGLDKGVLSRVLGTGRCWVLRGSTVTLASEVVQ